MTADDISRQLEEEGFGRLTLEEAGDFETYLRLLLKWKQKMSLTSIRTVAEIVSRHFGESLLCARNVPEGTGTLLDFGSGAGFPGVACAICNPSMQVTLAEANAKKAAFLREVRRSLHSSVLYEGRIEVYEGRVETMPAMRRFKAVTLRAVERMDLSCRDAVARLEPGGSLLMRTTLGKSAVLCRELPGITWKETVPIPQSMQRILARAVKVTE